MARACTTSQYFTLGTASALQITGDLTIMVWINGTSTPGGILACYDNGGSFTGYGFGIGQGVGAGLLSYWSNGVGSWQASSATVNSGAWRAVGIVISGTGAGAGTFLTDGATNGTWTHTAPGSFAGTKYIGAASGATSVLGDTLAELAVWNVALTANEIAAYANGILPLRLRPASLVAYWPMWGLHDPEIDFGPNKYTATLVAGPTLANHAPVMPFTHVSVSPLLEESPAAYAQVAYRWRAASGSLAAPG